MGVASEKNYDEQMSSGLHLKADIVRCSWLRDHTFRAMIRKQNIRPAREPFTDHWQPA
jgi:hypothetical protein